MEKVQLELVKSEIEKSELMYELEEIKVEES